jgi:hypothetical protein
MVERNDQWENYFQSLEEYAVYELSYLDKALELHSKILFRKCSFKIYIYKQKTFEKITKKSHRGVRSKLLLDLETGVILMIALYKDITEGQSKK